MNDLFRTYEENKIFLPKYDYSNYKEHDDKNDGANDDNRNAVESMLKIWLRVIQNYGVITSVV